MFNYTDDFLRDILSEGKVIAVVGHSDKPHRTSYQIAQVMRGLGYTIYPVNPTLEEINGQTCYPALADIPEHVDIVNVFRRAEHLAGVVEEAIEIGAGSVWGQLQVFNTQAFHRADEAELAIVMDRCIKVEHFRLFRGKVHHK